VVGIESEERLFLRQPRHRHEHRLAVLQRALAYRKLRGVRIRLQRARALPHRRRTEPFGGRFRAGEVRDASGGARKPGHLGRAHRRPHFFPQGRLRGQHVGGAASIAIMTRRGTDHAPILP
jgi:hypothetical protein